MTNTCLQTLFTTYGDRIFCINLDNGRYIYIGYKDSPKLADITLETVEGVDFIKVKRKNKSMGSIELEFTNFIPSETVQHIGIMDEGFEDYRVDPLLLR